MKKGNGMGWLIADCVIGLISGVTSIIGIYTGVKSAQAQQDLADYHIEKKYGLTVMEDYNEKD